MTADSLKYRLPILAGAILFMPLAGKVLGEKPLWQFGSAGVYVLACLVLAGISFTWWARIHLGRFWSNAISAAPRIAVTVPTAMPVTSMPAISPV